MASHADLGSEVMSTGDGQGQKKSLNSNFIIL